MNLFERFRKKKTIQPKSAKEGSEVYFFENHIEFMIYVAKYAKNKDVIWASGDDYRKQFNKGYRLFELGYYAKAIEAYRKCLKLNPIGINARFEICEAYLKLGKLAEARETLLAMQDFLIQRIRIAQFYRRMGYIEIEEGNYKTATACYLYSLKFADHPSVPNELKYIKVKGGFDEQVENFEETLTEANIPILKMTKSDSE